MTKTTPIEATQADDQNKDCRCHRKEPCSLPFFLSKWSGIACARFLRPVALRKAFFDVRTTIGTFHSLPRRRVRESKDLDGFQALVAEDTGATSVRGSTDLVSHD